LSSEFRFAVGDPHGPRSCSWRLAAKGDGAYLLQRNVGHSARLDIASTGNCRWVQVAGLRSGADRTLVTWRRGPGPVANDALQLVTAIRFPAAHLSTAYEGIKGAVTWLEPPAAGETLVLEVLFTDATGPGVAAEVAARARTLLFALPLMNGTLCLTRRTEPASPVELRIEQEAILPGQKSGALLFPAEDSARSGRPLRMAAVPQRGLPPQVWELGGFNLTAGLAPAG